MIIGLDASSTACGWAFAQYGDLLKSGVIDLGHDAPWFDRVRRLQAALHELFTEARDQYGSALVGYEVASGAHGNMKTNRILGAVEYAVRYVVSDFGWTIRVVSPMEVKATCVHKDALVYAEATIRTRDPSFLFDLTTTHARSLAGDQADAIGVAFATIAKLRKEGEYNA